MEEITAICNQIVLTDFAALLGIQAELCSERESLRRFCG
jgi:hypothetical protein